MHLFFVSLCFLWEFERLETTFAGIVFAELCLHVYGVRACTFFKLISLVFESPSLSFRFLNLLRSAFQARYHMPRESSPFWVVYLIFPDSIFLSLAAKYSQLDCFFCRSKGVLIAVLRSIFFVLTFSRAKPGEEYWVDDPVSGVFSFEARTSVYSNSKTNRSCCLTLVLSWLSENLFPGNCRVDHVDCC